MIFGVPSSNQWLLAAAVSLASAPVFATTIVAIRTPDIVVLAADSSGTFVGGAETIRTVCKIHKVGERFFAVAGLSEDPRRGFGAVGIVSRALRGTDGVMNAAAAAAEAMADPLARELTRLAAEDKPLLERSLAKLPSVILIGTDHGASVASGFQFEVAPNATWPTKLTLRTLKCPGD